jgi:glycine/D-amino acid oxidase-like deaminating enzyme
MGYVRGLARAALGAGARIATGVARHRAGAGRRRLARHNQHEATCARAYVVLATNAYTDDLWPGLSRGYTLIPYFQLTTEPLGDAANGSCPGGRECGTPPRS